MKYKGPGMYSLLSNRFAVSLLLIAVKKLGRPVDLALFTWDVIDCMVDPEPYWDELASIMRGVKVYWTPRMERITAQCRTIQTGPDSVIFSFMGDK